MKKIKVEVTAGDIKKGRVRAAFECPVALAIIRALKEVFGDKATSIGVCRVVINMTINDGKKMTQYVQNAPKAVADFIGKIDTPSFLGRKGQAGKKNAKPFSFLLQIPTLGKKEKKKDWNNIYTSDFPKNLEKAVEKKKK